MRIAIFFPRLKTFSGGEHLLVELCRRLVEWGHEPVVVTRAVAEECRAFLPAGLRVEVPKYLSGLTGIHLVDSFLDVALSPFLLARTPSDCDVHCFIADPVLPALWFGRRVLGRRTPTVYYCLQPPRFVYDLMAETVNAHRPLGYLIPFVAPAWRALDRIAARAADIVLALSEEYAAWSRELYRPAPVELVPPGVDLDLPRGAHPESVRPRFGFEPDAPIVLTVNKMIARKNLDVFLRAMKIVVERSPKSRGLVVGDGPLMLALLALRAELGLDSKVTFTGFLPDNEVVSDCYAASDVYVFLEKNVPFGLTVLEAGIFGLPSVAVRGGGTSDTVLDGESGLLVEQPLNAEEVADRICRLIADPDLRAAFGSKAADHARRFSWDASVRLFVAALEAVIARKPKSQFRDRAAGSEA